jgi:phospholipase C
MSWCGEIRYAIVRKRDEWRSGLVKTCTDRADEGYKSCAQKKDEGYNSCAQKKDEGYNSCAQQKDEGYNSCCDWWPCSWACDAWVWISNVVCVAWVWISNVVCVAWVWISNVVCVAWTWIVKWVCRAFAWLVYWILTIVAYLVWLVLWIPCHVFGGPSGPSGPVKHVFVLVLENRAFDHMLGVSTGISSVDPNSATPGLGFRAGVGVDATSGLSTTVDAPSNETNVHASVTFTVTAGAPFVMPVDPPHEFCDVKLALTSEPISGVPSDDTCAYSGVYPGFTMAGFIDNYANQAQVEKNDSDAATSAKGAAALADLGAVMKCFTPDQVPVLSTLARDFALCDQWFSALPGPTWPNRFFFHAATSGGLDHSPSTASVVLSQVDGYQFENGTIYDALDSEELDWHIYHGDMFPVVGALAGMDLGTMATHFSDMDDFAADVMDPGFSPAYVFIEPNYGHVLTHGGDFQCGNSQHPVDDVTRGEKLVKLVYESIRQSPHWNSSVLVVAYDEHGGFYDHVEPPPAVPPGDVTDPDNNIHGFGFDTQGVRVPAVVVSPLIPSIQMRGVDDQNCNLIDHTKYDHTSLLATVERFFGLPHLTDRDAQAAEFGHLLSLSTPRTDAPWTLPDSADSGFVCDDDPPSSGRSSSQQSLHGDIAQADPLRPISETMRGFVQLAAIHDLRLNPNDRTTILDRLRSVETVGQARVYMDDVATRLRARLITLRAQELASPKRTPTKRPRPD